MYNNDGTIKRVEVYYDEVFEAIDLITIRLNRGQSFQQAIDETSNYSNKLKQGFSMINSPYRLEFSQLLIYYKFSDYFFVFLECLRVTQHWDPYQVCDVLLHLKSKLKRHHETEGAFSLFSRKNKQSSDALEITVQKFLSAILQGDTFSFPC